MTTVEASTIEEKTLVISVMHCSGLGFDNNILAIIFETKKLRNFLIKQVLSAHLYSKGWGGLIYRQPLTRAHLSKLQWFHDCEWQLLITSIIHCFGSGFDNNTLAFYCQTNKLRNAHRKQVCTVHVYSKVHYGSVFR